MSIPAPFEWLSAEEAPEHLQSRTRPSLFYFTQPGANLCELINPIVGRVCEKQAGRFHFRAVNVTEDKDLAYDHNVMRAPSFVLYRDGVQIRRWTDVEYNQSFETEMHEFLAGDFLFERESFRIPEDRDFFREVRRSFDFNVIAFLEPAEPMNWRLKPVLEELEEHRSGKFRVFLVNATRNNTVPTHYKIKNHPAVLLIEDNEVLERWDPVEDPVAVRDGSLAHLDSPVS